MSYSAAGNVTTHRNRAGETTSFAYDALGRRTQMVRPNNEDEVGYGYDLLGRLTRAEIPGHVLAFGYDALGRQLTQSSPRGTYTSAFDLAGRRTRLTHPDGFFVDYDRMTTGEVTKIRENGATSGVGVLATFGYDDRGRRTSLTRGNGTVTTYAYDRPSRLTQLTHDVPDAARDLTLGFAYNPAAQIVSNSRSNDAFAQTPLAGTQTATPNGLNQLSQVNGTATSHDARGNMTNDGSASYAYRSDNAMTNGAGTPLLYDPLGRLTLVLSGAWTRFAYDGANIVAEQDAIEQLQRRYVHADGVDEPIVQYEGSGTSTRRFLHADERGSIVAHSDGSGTVTQVNRYDEYGAPASGNAGRFQYTGLAWIAEAGLQYSRARMYNPRLGRFMQTDPIGYGDGINMHAYVGGDPVNSRDPSGAITCNSAETRMVRCAPDTDDIAQGDNHPSLSHESRHSTSGGRSIFVPHGGSRSLNVAEATMIISGRESQKVKPYLSLLDQPAGTSYGELRVPDGGFTYFSWKGAIATAKIATTVAESRDPWTQYALRPDVRAGAVANGTLFIIPSRDYTMGSLLLQSEATLGGRRGVVEYLMPISMGCFFIGRCTITHARFVDGPISGVVNNFGGRRAPPYVSPCLPPDCA